VKRPLRFALLLLISALALSVGALADTGPKPQLTVRVLHAPEELYYLDLVEEDRPDRSRYDSPWANQASLDASMADALRSAVPEGWHACLLDGTYGPMWGELTPGKDSLHTFGYCLPDTYRIALVTQSGETWVSEPCTRRTLQSSATVDWASRTVSVPPVWVAYVLEFLATFLPTLLLEGALLPAFHYHLKASWKPFLLVNLATQIGFYLLIGTSVVRHGFSAWYIFDYVPVELVIVLAEVLLYRRFLTERGKRTAAAYAVAANLLSACVGWYLAYPVWRWIASVS
jgi:hypothetical protein